MYQRDLDGAADAAKAVAANMSPRARYLDMLERWAECTQYEGLPDWFDDSCEKPIWERAPCIVYPIIKTAASSNVDLVLGEGRFPSISSMPDEDDGDAEGGVGDDEEAEALDRFVADLIEKSRYKAVSRQALYAAQTVGSACAILGIRGGRPFIELAPAKWCTPELDDEGRVTRLVIEYPYITEEKIQGKWRAVAKLYRRVIDSERDVTMLPALADVNGQEPSWTPDPKRTVRHGLGFCPVVWYAFMKPSTTMQTVDGQAIQSHCLDEIRAHDFALSQRHRSALFLGDPQIVETGVEKDYQPAAMGRTAVPLPTTPAGGKITRENQPRGEFRVSAPKKARRKSPGELWTYESPDVKVGYLALSGDALKPIDEHAADLRNKIAESLFVVFLDPENIKFAATTSGKALETLRERQLSRCDMIRDDFAAGFMLPVLQCAIRIVVTKAASTTVRVAKVDEVASALDAFVDGQWVGPALSLRWGPYFRSDVDEESKTVTMVATARTAGLITRRMATEKLKGAFSIENVDHATEAIGEEAADASKEAEVATMVKLLAVPSVAYRKALYKRLARATLPGIEEQDLAVIDREIDKGVTEADLEPPEPAETPDDPKVKDDDG